MNLKLKFVTMGGDYDESGYKKRLCSFSAAGIVAWNDDLLIEILLRLPAKSLTRFKVVCKHWLSLISAHEFCRLHTLRHPKLQPSLIFRMHGSQFFYFHPTLNSPRLIPYSFNIPNPRILSSSNGLVLLQSDNPEKDYYVYNPTTKQSRKISLTKSNKFKNVLGLHLAFDPSKSPHYKILCLRSPKKSQSSNQVEVYDSESRIWQLCLEPLDSIQADFPCDIHWTNTIHRGCGHAACSCQLQVFNGHYYHFIHFIIISDLGDKSIAVYKCQGDYDQWMSNYHDQFGQAPDRFRMLNFIRGDDGKTCTLLTHIPGKIAAYRFHDKSSKKLIDFRDEPFYNERPVQFDSKDVFQFGESLALV